MADIILDGFDELQDAFKAISSIPFSVTRQALDGMADVAEGKIRATGESMGVRDPDSDVQEHILDKISHSKPKQTEDGGKAFITFLGSPEGVQDAAVALAKKAAELIDMTKHVGEHSRMGATDVIPFVPTMDVTVQECVEMSKRLGQRIWDELKIPSFLYEDSASSPDRVNLAKVRKGQFEGMPEKLLQPEWAPDFGERAIHPTAGITAIGARMPLVAFNVNLATADVEIAKNIAKVIRASSGGFKYCKAAGFMLEDRGIAQVSMNMVNYEGTQLFVVYEMIKALAERYGTSVIGTEVVGLTPAKALIDCAEFYLKIENFDCHNQVMEYHLIGME